MCMLLCDSLCLCKEKVCRNLQASTFALNYFSGNLLQTIPQEDPDPTQACLQLTQAMAFLWELCKRGKQNCCQLLASHGMMLHSAYKFYEHTNSLVLKNVSILFVKHIYHTVLQIQVCIYTNFWKKKETKCSLTEAWLQLLSLLCFSVYQLTNSRYQNIRTFTFFGCSADCLIVHRRSHVLSVLYK